MSDEQLHEEELKASARDDVTEFCNRFGAEGITNPTAEVKAAAKELANRYGIDTAKQLIYEIINTPKQVEQPAKIAPEPSISLSRTEISDAPEPEVKPITFRPITQIDTSAEKTDLPPDAQKVEVITKPEDLLDMGKYLNQTREKLIASYEAVGYSFSGKELIGTKFDEGTSKLDDIYSKRPVKKGDPELTHGALTVIGIVREGISRKGKLISKPVVELPATDEHGKVVYEQAVELGSGGEEAGELPADAQTLEEFEAGFEHLQTSLSEEEISVTKNVINMVKKILAGDLSDVTGGKLISLFLTEVIPYPTGTPEEIEKKQWINRNAENIIIPAKAALEKNGYIFINPEVGSDKFNASDHQFAGSEKTDDPALNEVIAKVIRPGLKVPGGKVEDPAKVIIFTYEKPGGGEGKLPDPDQIDFGKLPDLSDLNGILHKPEFDFLDPVQKGRFIGLVGFANRVRENGADDMRGVLNIVLPAEPLIPETSFSNAEQENEARKLNIISDRLRDAIKNKLSEFGYSFREPMPGDSFKVGHDKALDDQAVLTDDKNLEKDKIIAKCVSAEMSFNGKQSYPAFVGLYRYRPEQAGAQPVKRENLSREEIKEGFDQAIKVISDLDVDDTGHSSLSKANLLSSMADLRTVSRGNAFMVNYHYYNGNPLLLNTASALDKLSYSDDSEISKEAMATLINLAKTFDSVGVKYTDLMKMTPNEALEAHKAAKDVNAAQAPAVEPPEEKADVPPAKPESSGPPPISPNISLSDIDTDDTLHQIEATEEM